MNKRLQFNKLISLLLIISMVLCSGSIVYSAENSGFMAQANKSTKIDLIPKFEKSQNLYGYVDKSGKWVIKPQFSYANNFSEGLAAVAEDTQNCQWGYIQPDGTYAIKPKYLRAYDFKNGFAVVNDKMLAATINRKGDYISQTQYYLKEADTSERYRADITDVNTVMVKNAKYGLITNDGKIIEPEYDGLPYVEEEFLCVYKEDASMDPFKRKVSFISNNNKVIAIEGRIISSSEGFALVKHDTVIGKNGVEKRESYSYLTSAGEIIKSFKDKDGKEYPFLEAKDFSEGFACVMVNTHESGVNPYYDKWGFLKTDGTFLIDPCYINAKSFKNGVAPVKYHSCSWGYIKKDLSWFIKPVMDNYYGKEYDYCVNESKVILRNLINNSMSDYEKLEKIYSYITDTVNYDYSGDANLPRVSYSAYGALKYHRCVCEGYADLTKIMLDLAGVESILISGEVEGTPHGWNLVKLNGDYYHIDATSDSNGSNKGTKVYFLKSDEFMKKSRTWNTDKFPAALKNY